ncbi:unnamed protein product [Fusarium graminearum]|uniref:Uncharacterized protein n=1 Tax=Gibberella zeae TaxID=5518 RepID=A0A4E9EFB7_GIBZA|nr:unnamed protein product [Fusarium graminearum]
MIFKVKDMRASGELHSILSLPITRGDYGRGLSAGGQDSGQGKEEIPFRQRAVTSHFPTPVSQKALTPNVALYSVCTVETGHQPLDGQCVRWKTWTYMDSLSPSKLKICIHGLVYELNLPGGAGILRCATRCDKISRKSPDPDQTPEPRSSQKITAFSKRDHRHDHD